MLKRMGIDEAFKCIIVLDCGKQFQSGKRIDNLYMWDSYIPFLAQHSNISTSRESTKASSSKEEKRYVYGLAGIARLFGCSLPTANRIKQSGKINRAITQVGRKIIVDADLALELAGRKIGGR